MYLKEVDPQLQIVPSAATAGLPLLSTIAWAESLLSGAHSSCATTLGPNVMEVSA